jgi:transcriptional regulator with XRE-family HTH domain
VAAARTDLQTFLRAWRDRLSPEDAGLASGGGRRAPGLRREELAALAGISVDYITRLEQGRAHSPSAQVVASLARALQLDVSERDHLYRSAGLLPPQAGLVPMQIPAGVQRLITRLGEIPLAVFAADWTLLSWTPLWEALLGDPLLLPAEERNLIHLTFERTSEKAAHSPITPVRSAAGDAATQAALVADVRSASSAYPRDQRLQALIRRARANSPRFAHLWATGTVGSHTGDQKTVMHPLVGDITLDCDILHFPGADLRVVAYTVAAGSSDAGKLDVLRVTGAHAFRPPTVPSQGR